MKQWSVDYSVRYMNGHIDEMRFTVEGCTIQDALDEAERTLVFLECEHDDIAETVIWDIGLMVDNFEDLTEPFRMVV